METRLYYYAIGGQKFGPFQLGEIEKQKISSDTLIWFDGLTNWKPASELTELKYLFPILPPPIPKTAKGLLEEKKQRLSLKYDLEFPKQKETANIGVGIFIFSALINIYASKFMDSFKNGVGSNNNLDTTTPLTMLLIFTIGIHIAGCIVAIKTAKKLNRDYVGAAICALIIPSLTLIYLGYVRKLIS